MKRTFALMGFILLVLASTSLAFTTNKGGITYDSGLVDNIEPCWIQFSSTTGHYVFNDCEGTYLAGVGSVLTGIDGSLTLKFNNGQYKGLFTQNKVTNTGSGYLIDRTTGLVEETITDLNTLKNVYVCPPAEE